MNEADIRNHLHHALMFRGWTPHHAQDARVVTCNVCHKGKITLYPQTPGRADTVARHYTVDAPIIHIEVKAVRDTAFAFSDIRPEQHVYLDKRLNSYLCLGKILPKGKTQTTIHSIYVIPWAMWMEWERHSLILGLESIPYSYELYTNNVVKKQTDLATRLAGPTWQIRYSNGDYHFDPLHPLSVMEEVEVPFFKRSKDNEAEQHA